MQNATRQFLFTSTCTRSSYNVFEEHQVDFRLTVTVDATWPPLQKSAEDALDTLSFVVRKWLNANLHGKVLLGLGDAMIVGWATDNLRGRQPFFVSSTGDVDGLAPFLYHTVLPALLNPCGLSLASMTLQQFNRPEVHLP